MTDSEKAVDSGPFAITTSDHRRAHVFEQIVPFRIGMVLPTVLALILIVGFPLGYAAWISVHEYDLTEGGIGNYVELANFERVLELQPFRTAAVNTIVLTVSVVLIELAIALGLALLLSQPGLQFKNVYLAIMLIPLLVSPVAVGLIWRLLLHPDLGAINWALSGVGLPGQEWLGSTDTAMPTVIGVDAWHETSLLLVILLAGVTSLPKDPVEAATVDGASKWQVFYSITIPLLTPVIMVAVLIRMIAAMKTYDLIYVLTSGGPGSATETISYRISKVAFTALDMGRASAASILLLLVVMVMTIVLTRVMAIDFEA
jgi:multiple sugar transport system permease protein